MSWTDKIATEEIIKLKTMFGINTFVETGTYRGINAELVSYYFPRVLTCEANEEYFNIAQERLKTFDNIYIKLEKSSDFLAKFKKDYCKMNRQDTVFFYFDAHFFDPDSENKWVVNEELKALKGFKNCIIAIHDFDCSNLGHLCYEGEHLNFKVVEKYITKVNPDFHYYTNTKEYCDIYDEKTIYNSGIRIDEGVLDNIKYANSSDEKKYRGILYAAPRELDLNMFRLKEFRPEWT